jgi:hypothetical protein
VTTPGWRAARCLEPAIAAGGWRTLWLTSKRLAGNNRLQLAAENNPPLRTGHTGDAVAILQQALLSLNCPMPISTASDTRAPDGIYGPETAKAVAAFQAQFGLSVDGIAGRQTLAQLDQLFANRPLYRPSACGNCFSHTGPPLFQLISAKGAPTRADIAGSARLPTTIRFLTQSEITQAQSVFGNSLDFARILATDALGVDGRAFVMVNPVQSLQSLFSDLPLPPNTKMQVVNWGPAPSSARFFHELTHVWQSQHHVAPEAFMINAVASQAVASLFGGDAYAYIPNRPFASYGAEQVAQQVENSKAAIINHIRAVPANIPDPTNLPSPGLPRWETPGAPGVET